MIFSWIVFISILSLIWWTYIIHILYYQCQEIVIFSPLICFFSSIFVSVFVYDTFTYINLLYLYFYVHKILYIYSLHMHRDKYILSAVYHVCYFFSLFLLSESDQLKFYDFSIWFQTRVERTHDFASPGKL